MSRNDTRSSSRAAGGAGSAARGGSGLRTNAFSAAVMLLVQYGLGIWVNLYAQIPASDQGKGTFAAFGAAVADGPVALAVHAGLGTLLILTAVILIIRAVLARKTAAIVIGAIAFLAVLAAWLSGARFVGDAADGASFGMAIATGVALLGYVIILFVPGTTERS
ncbi:MAG: hypothetical protein FWE35_20055 [Streptosporangiales bacterium]|nr:hypothetical protein [Streptosporangiales bacterium]